MSVWAKATLTPRLTAVERNVQAITNCSGRSCDWKKKEKEDNVNTYRYYRNIVNIPIPQAVPRSRKRATSRRRRIVPRKPDLGLSLRLAIPIKFSLRDTSPVREPQSIFRRTENGSSCGAARSADRWRHRTGTRETQRCSARCNAMQ